jgi:hypothetical protein
MNTRRFQDVWIDQCRAAERIRHDHGIKNAFDYLVAEKLMNFAEASATRPEFARELPRFVAEVRRLFSADEVQEHLARIERQERAAADATSGAEFDELEAFDTPEMDAARRGRFAALKVLLLAEQLGTS